MHSLPVAGSLAVSPAGQSRGPPSSVTKIGGKAVRDPSAQTTAAVQLHLCDAVVDAKPFQPLPQPHVLLDKIQAPHSRLVCVREEEKDLQVLFIAHAALGVLSLIPLVLTSQSQKPGELELPALTVLHKGNATALEQGPQVYDALTEGPGEKESLG